MDHLTKGKPMKISRANLKGEYKSKTRSKITPKQYEDTKAQTRFRQRSESYWKKQKGILGDQITDPETGEIYDQASIQPYQQRQINKTLGLSEEHDVGEKIIGDEYHHPVPAKELGVLQAELYSFGGVGGVDAAPGNPKTPREYYGPRVPR